MQTLFLAHQSKHSDVTLIEKCQNWYSWYLLTFFNQSDIGTALIANTIFDTSIKAFRYHFDWKMSKLIFLISFDIFQSKWHRNGFNFKHYFWHTNAFRYHFNWKMSKQIKDISFLTLGVKGLTQLNFKYSLEIFYNFSCYIKLFKIVDIP